MMKVSRINMAASRKREYRVLFLVVTMVVCYLLCWLPYGVVALLATLGRPGLVTPVVSIVPSLLAKTSSIINPVIYIFMNKQFSRCFRALLRCTAPEVGSSNNKYSTKATRTLKTRRHTQCHHPALVAVAGHRVAHTPDSSRLKGTSDPEGPDPGHPGQWPTLGVVPGPVKPTLSLVAYYQS